MKPISKGSEIGTAYSGGSIDQNGAAERIGDLMLSSPKAARRPFAAAGFQLTHWKSRSLKISRLVSMRKHWGRCATHALGASNSPLMISARLCVA